MREALEKLERRFKQNVDAYQDRYFTYSYRNWHKKAVEAAKWRDIFSDLREEVRAALEPKNKEVGRGGRKMDDKQETITDKHKSAATAVGNAAKMREALEHVEKLANELAAGNYYVSDFPKMIHDAIQPALSAPARNCDLYTSRSDAWVEFRKKNQQSWYEDLHLNFPDWLFAEAKGETNGSK